GTALWQDETTQFNISATQALKLLAGGTSDISASVSTAPLNLNFQGQGNISADQFFEGALNAKTPSLNEATLWLGLTPVLSRAEIGNFSLDSAITFTPKRLKFSNIELRADENTAKGVIEIGFEKEQPTVTATLAFD